MSEKTEASNQADKNFLNSLRRSYVENKDADEMYADRFMSVSNEALNEEIIQVCPNCGFPTEQFKCAPFCGNCGYEGVCGDPTA